MAGSIVAGRYQLGGTIGVGGMGFVYEALDLQTGCEVAIKALQPGAYDPDRFMRLRREAATATAVRNKHVCQVYYLGVEHGTPFIVMERLHGETLHARLGEGDGLPAEEAVTMTCQLLDALSATHRAGVIHRDVKPSNIFLTSRRNEPPMLKLIDFGLAKARRGPGGADTDRGVSLEITRVEQVAGTLSYLAPEQVLAQGNVDERVDVYAAGVTLFEMLTGTHAYSGTSAEIVHEIILGDPPKARRCRPELPPLIDDVLAMAMAKTRDRRFASAAAFKRALLAADGRFG